MILLFIACGGQGSEPAPESVAPLPTDDSRSESGPPDSPGDSLPELHGCADARQPLDAETCIQEAPCAWSGEQSYEYSGVSVALADLDGDGALDLVFAAPAYNTDLSDVGRVRVVSGASLLADGLPSTVYTGTAAYEYAGQSLAAGDLDGDGVAELVVGAMGIETLAESAGGLVIVAGASTRVLPSEVEYGRAGYATVVADLDGDGLGDLVTDVGLYEWDGDSERWSDGGVRVLRGSALGVATTLADADVVFTGSGGAFGRSLAAGDVDGDGVEDLVVGAPYDNAYKGRTWVIPGSAALASGAAGALGSAINGETSSDAFGWAVATAELDGDAAAEILVGAPLRDEGGRSSGKVYAYDGGALLQSWVGPEEFELGTGVGAADLDGDGLDSPLTGAVNAWKHLSTKSGRIYALDLANPDPRAGAVQVQGAGVKDYLGGAMVAGDVDGDGKEDLLIGGGYTNVEGQYDVGVTSLLFGG